MSNVNFLVSTCWVLLVISCCQVLPTASANQCQAKQYVYGENSIFDELLVCSLSKNFDLDLTPQGDHVKSTARALIDQGLSDKTTIVHARLGGFWTTRRPSFVETGWRCDSGGKIHVNSLIEMSNLVLEVIERIDIPHHRNQHKLALHRPCKTLDLPLWMCRQSNPIYRTVTTWVNKAYFNVTLGQEATETKPSIEKLAMVFTCPETFKQKITHSPSAAYLLNKHIQGVGNGPVTKVIVGDKKQTSHSPQKEGGLVDDALAHPTHSHSTIQTGRSPASPPYHNSVNLITTKVTEVLKKSLDDCVHLIDSDLSQMRDHSSFKLEKYIGLPEDTGDDSEPGPPPSLMVNECSNKISIRNRIELAIQASAFPLTSRLAESLSQAAVNGAGGGLTKRHQQESRSAYPNDPNQLLDPYASYHEPMDGMINYS